MHIQRARQPSIVFPPTAIRIYGQDRVRVFTMLGTRVRARGTGNVVGMGPLVPRRDAWTMGPRSDPCWGTMNQEMAPGRKNETLIQRTSPVPMGLVFENRMAIHVPSQVGVDVDCGRRDHVVEHNPILVQDQYWSAPVETGSASL